MAIIQIKSENPKFSWVLQKNPESGILIKPIRKGFGFAWFGPNAQTFNMFFQDGQDEISYKTSKNQVYEYNCPTSYNASLPYLGLINEYCNHLFHKIVEHDVEATHEIIISQLEVQNPRHLKFFTKYFPEVEIEAQEKIGCNYRIIIKTDWTLSKSLNFVMLFLFFNMLNSDQEYQYLTEADIEKYLKLVNYLDAPYFIRYMFKFKILRSPKNFEKYKPELQKTERCQIDFEFGDTGDQRREFIANRINNHLPILDFGCGEMRTYGRYLLKRCEAEYYAIDSNVELIENLRKKFEKRKEYEKSNGEIKFYPGIIPFLDDNPQTDRIQIILSEVIEHMPVSDAKVLISILLLNLPKMEKLIITTPDGRFNQFYDLENEFRHPDHQFEPTNDEFIEMVESALKLCKRDDLKYTWYQFGDRVNGLTNSQAIIIEKA